MVRSRFRLGSLVDGLSAVNSGLAALLFAGLTVIVALQVFTRFVLHAPMIWSEELARFLFFWVVMLGAAMSVKTRRHFVLDITMGGGAARWPMLRFVLDLVPNLCILGFSLLLFVQGVGYTEVGLLRTATNTQLNMGLVYVAIPVFAALSAIYSATHLVADFRAYVLRRGAPTPPPPSPPGGE